MVSLPFEGLMVRVPHHDPEHGRRVMARLRVSPRLSSVERLSRTLSLSNRSNHFVPASRGGCYIEYIDFSVTLVADPLRK